MKGMTTHSYSRSRSVGKRNAGSVDDCGTSVSKFVQAAKLERRQKLKIQATVRLWTYPNGVLLRPISLARYSAFIFSIASGSMASYSPASIP